MNAVKLKNGTEEADVAVMATMASLRKLWEMSPIVVYDLVMLCRTGAPPFNAKALADAQLVRADGKVHETIRNVVLSAVVGEGMAMTLGSPLA